MLHLLSVTSPRLWSKFCVCAVTPLSPDTSGMHDGEGGFKGIMYATSATHFCIPYAIARGVRDENTGILSGALMPLRAASSLTDIRLR